MARNLQINELVFAPRARLGMSLDAASAFYDGKVAEIEDRSVRLALPGGKVTDWIAAAHVHRNIGVCLFRIGDFDTEPGLLDPLAKSVHHFLRMLLPDSMLRVHYVRSRDELEHYWSKEHALYSHVILVGHGRRDGVKFGLTGWLDAQALAGSFSPQGCSPKNFVCLCCETGYADFSQTLSLEYVCSSVIAPFHDVHGAIASQFCQSLLTYHLLEGETISVAYRHARSGVPGGSIFRLWQNGCLSTPS